LYRELIDAITPWIAQQTGGRVQMGLVSTIALAAFGWVGIRAMTWFLFARYGTGTLVAILSRETALGKDRAPAQPVPVSPAVWSEAVAALKQQSEWFKQEGRYAFELVSLPVLQLLATAVNFVVVAVRSEPLFALPFKSLDDVVAAVPRIETPRSTVLRHNVEPAKGGTR
ncbi:MAG: hypothetical protein HY560_07790, partial [Gemmatimonadetes bacterium]|nr:hypothetical protein [Gemmatimonadota bacterium]